MSSATTSHSLNTRSHLPTFGNFGNTLLERGNPGIRRSTPDSEALASSDEEVEQSRLRTASQRRNLPNRRSSLLAEQQAENRRASLAGSNSYSPATGSQPNTPGVSQDAWSTISPGSGTWSGATGYPFGSSIWGSRDPPSRLQEVSVGSDTRLPFAIPPQPNPSTYRSMSFSVGQTEMIPQSQSPVDNRPRPGGPIQRRSSRQGLLGNLDEVEDDGSSISNDLDPPRSSHSARGQSQLMRNQMRTFSSSSSQFLGNAPPANRLRSSPYETSELAIDDTDEPAQLRYPIRNAPTRRLSDIQSLQTTRPANNAPYSSTSFAGRRAHPHWSSELDFGQLEAIPQSRRHSFADVPTRRGSLGSNGLEHERLPGTLALIVSIEDERSTGQDAHSQGLSQDTELSYYVTDDAKRREAEQEVQRKLLRQQSQSLFGGNTTYGIPSQLGAYHGPSNVPLYIVNFKCSRTDVFYIQEGTGLEVEPGNLVIVEADRGTDLGTVQHANVSWEEAKYFKAYYAEEHYKWLMMFSQQSRVGGPNASNPNPVNPRSAGQGPGHRDTHNDIKPKMIKRLAQPHEIQALQEKEGNEAKAKRVCQQRVAEHGLNMEILDAEFQMDSKKLTFYYFADTYINFNALVTDLFKIYKTRIWMSAINPASFMTPTSSLGLTPAFAGSSFGSQGSQYPMGNSQPYEDPRDQARGYPQQRHAMPGPYYGNQGHMPGAQGGFPSSMQAPMQAPMDPFSAYTTQAYGMFPGRPSTLGLNRQDSIPRSTHAGPPGQHDLATHFGNLSLDRFGQNTSNHT